MLKTVTRAALLVLVIALMGTHSAVAQTGTITGTIKDSVTTETLPGANVYISELDMGTATGGSGRFTLEGVPVGEHVLRVTFIGFSPKRVPVEVQDGQTTNVEIFVTPQAMGMESVVVTALGIERSERSLGYSAQNVSASQVEEAEATNFVNALQGHIAGAQISNSTGGVGSSSRIVLRGASSLSGDSQPLIIVDGVAIDNSNFGAATSSGWDATEIDYGNAAMNISPQNIESINVLKGPNAAAMYGSRAANGAIVIETKDGSGVEGVEVNYSTGVDLQSILVMPDYQNQFGHGQINAEGEPQFAWVDGRGGGTFDAVGESWGPRLDTGEELPQWFSAPDAAPWTSHPGNTRSYFNQGSRITNNLSVSGNFGDSRFRVSAKNLQHSGMVPNSRLQRTNVTLAGGAQFTDQLSGSGKVTYIKTNAENRPERGYTWNNVMFTIGQWTARQINMDRLSEYKDADGNMQNWNMIHENPYWIQFENTNEQWKDQVRGNVSLTYDFADWLSAKVFTGIDVYEDRREEVYSVGSNRSRNGEYTESIRYVSEWNSRLTFELNRDITDQISVTSRFGVENRKRRYNLNSAYASALSVPGVHNIENAATRPELQDWTLRKGTNSLYGQASIGFREYLYLDLTGRNDWTSTLPEDNNSYFYPSVSLSFILTDAFESAMDWAWLDYAKLRGGWTQVGNDTDPYQLSATFSSLQAFGNIPVYSIATTVPNQELKPEQTEAWEVGADFRFFNDRMRLNLTYYDESTTNQIVPINVSRASGAEQRVSNIGEIANSGIEASLSGTPVQTDDFSWEATVNFSQNHNEVVRLTEGLNSFVLSSDGISIEARPGEEFGAIYGTSFQRDEDGNIIVDDRGIPLRNDEIQSFGSYAPDWSGSIQNRFSYGNLSLSVLVDTKQGGSIYLDSQKWGHFAGTYQKTVKGRTGPWVYQGEQNAPMAVKQDGSKNDIPITMSSVQDFWRQMSTIEERYIYDASYVKLRNVNLSYSIPQSWLSGTPIQGWRVTATGRNLAILHKNAPHIDPETVLSTNSSFVGMESNQIPPARTYGFSTTITF